MRILWPLGLALVAAAAQAGEPPSVSARASKTRLTVGEPFQVEVRASGPPGTAWTFPEQAGDERVELRASPASPSPDAQSPTDRREYQAAAFALDEAAVPALSVRYRLADGSEGEARTDPIPLSIVSVLPQDARQRTLADIRGPLGLPAGRAFYAALALAAVIAIASAWAVRRELRRRRLGLQPAPVAVQPPDREALAALDALLAAGSLEAGRLRPFYIALAEIAKRYLERRLEAPVLEMTSTEMIAFLRQHPLGDPFADRLRDLATAADQVKFARGAGRREEAERHLAAARELVLSLEARLRPQPEAQEKVA